MRVLVSSTGGAGHLGPLLPFAAALGEGGHEVLFVVPPELEASVAVSGHAYELGASPPAEKLDPILARLADLAPQEAAVVGNRDVFGRLWTAAMLPALERTVAEWRPDLVLREPCEYASAIAADRHRVPHGQVAISLAAVEWRSLELVAPVLGDALVARLRASPYLSRFPAPLDRSPFSDTRRYREEAGASSPLPDWWLGSAHPLVYVTFGTVASRLDVGRRAYRVALEAVDGLPARVLVTTAGAALPECLPANVHVEEWVPQSDALASAALVVCHGGSGTAFGAVAAGVPLVLIPLFADQRPNAALLADAGAGLVSGLDHGASALRAAIDTALETSAYRRRAEQIRDAMQTAPGPLDALLQTTALRPTNHGALTAPTTTPPARPTTTTLADRRVPMSSIRGTLLARAGSSYAFFVRGGRDPSEAAKATIALAGVITLAPSACGPARDGAEDPQPVCSQVSADFASTALCRAGVAVFQLPVVAHHATRGRTSARFGRVDDAPSAVALGVTVDRTPDRRDRLPQRQRAAGGDAEPVTHDLGAVGDRQLDCVVALR